MAGGRWTRTMPHVKVAREVQVHDVDRVGAGSSRQRLAVQPCGSQTLLQARDAVAVHGEVQVWRGYVGGWRGGGRGLRPARRLALRRAGSGCSVRWRSLGQSARVPPQAAPGR